MDARSQLPHGDSEDKGFFAPPQFTSPARLDVPTFPRVVAVIDLLFCAIRALLVVSALYMIVKGVDPNNPLMQRTAWPEVIAGIGIVVFAGVAAIGILTQAEWAVPIGWIAVVCTAASTAVGLWQVTIALDQIPRGVDRESFLVGAAGTLITRAALLVMYAFALRSYAKWVQRRSQDNWQQSTFDPR